MVTHQSTTVHRALGKIEDQAKAWSDRQKVESVIVPHEPRHLCDEGTSWFKLNSKFFFLMVGSLCHFSDIFIDPEFLRTCSVSPCQRLTNGVCFRQILVRLIIFVYLGRKTDGNGNAMLPKKLWISEVPALRFLYRSLWAQIFKKKGTKLSTKYEKKILGQILGQDRPEKNSAKCFIRSGEIPSPRQTSIDKTNDCVMNSERGAIVRCSEPPSGHSVHNTAGDTSVS